MAKAMNGADPSIPGPSCRPTTGGATAMTTEQDVFDQFESYRFSDDPEFRAGLPTVIAAIRGQERSADQIDEMIGRAQWFYFTRLKNVSIPWEAYARRQRSVPYVDPVSPKPGLLLSRSPTNTPKLSPSSRPDPKEALQTLNNLAEARQMMHADAAAAGSASQTGGGAGKGKGNGKDDGGLSFAMLSRLIAEGRTAEVPVRDIPDGVNEAQPAQASMSARPKPWEMAQSPPLPNPYGVGGYGISPTSFGYNSTSNAASSGQNSPYLHTSTGTNSNNISLSPQQPWASPGLGTFDNMSLDPYSHGPAGVSSSSASSFNLQSSSSYDASATDDTTFSNYLNIDYDYDQSTDPSQPMLNVNSRTVPSPSPGAGVFRTSSASTPAPAQSHKGSSGADNTPASSHSL